jgi:hypothetical protein
VNNDGQISLIGIRILGSLVAIGGTTSNGVPCYAQKIQLSLKLNLR